MIGLSHCNISYSEVQNRNETQNFRFFLQRQRWYQPRRIIMSKLIVVGGIGLCQCVTYGQDTGLLTCHYY